MGDALGCRNVLILDFDGGFIGNTHLSKLIMMGGDLWLIHVDVWQKLTQYCRTIILQLKINKFNY